MEFLQIQPDTHVYEGELEQALIDHLQHFLLELGTRLLLCSSTEEVYAGWPKLFHRPCVLQLHPKMFRVD